MYKRKGKTSSSERKYKEKKHIDKNKKDLMKQKLSQVFKK